MAYTSTNPRLNTMTLNDLGSGGAVTNPPSGTTTIVDRNGVLYLRDSSGNETQIGTGSGLLNNLTSPNTAGGWTASGAGVTVATTTTSTDLPLGAVIPTAIKVTPVSSTAYAYTRFTMPASLFQVKQQISWYQRPLSGYASGDMKVDLYVNSASNYGGSYTRVALSTDSSAVSSIPNLSGYYATTFDADSNLYYELRYTRVAGTTAINFADVILGPGVGTQGAVVSPWASDLTFTPVGFGTVTVRKNTYQRVVNRMIVRLDFVSGTSTATTALITLPTGYTIDSTLCSTTTNTQKVGWWLRATSGAANVVTSAASLGAVFYDGSTNNQIFVATTTTSNAYVKDNGNSICVANDNIGIEFDIPIAEWAGSGTVNLAANAVEYVSNSTTTDASDTTAFAYGPAGSVVPTVAASAVATSRDKRVRFSTPILATDTLVIQIQDQGTGPWMALEEQGSYSVYLRQGATAFGISFLPVSGSSTDLDVSFYQGGRTASNATFASAGSAFPRNATDRYRILKAAGGQAVGFGEVVPGTSSGLVGASGLKGKTNGVAATTGCVGETISASLTTDTTVSSTTFVSVTGASLALTAGSWLVFFNGKMTMGGAGAGIVQMFTGSTFTAGNAVFGPNAAETATMSFVVPLNISTTTTYVLKIAVAGGPLTFSCSDGSVANDGKNQFYAVRIA